MIMITGLSLALTHSLTRSLNGVCILLHHLLLLRANCRFPPPFARKISHLMNLPSVDDGSRCFKLAFVSSSSPPSSWVGSAIMICLFICLMSVVPFPASFPSVQFSLDHECWSTTHHIALRSSLSSYSDSNKIWSTKQAEFVVVILKVKGTSESVHLLWKYW